MPISPESGNEITIGNCAMGKTFRTGDLFLPEEGKNAEYDLPCGLQSTKVLPLKIKTAVPIFI